ncbi:MAG: hypothetical protein CM15mV4_3060 [Caudoviricetes sp.]|nr:MAG: hypothetical protein CM15mV4_3060 [Caudoviricetes sp.]
MGIHQIPADRRAVISNCLHLKEILLMILKITIGGASLITDIPH